VGDTRIVTKRTDEGNDDYGQEKEEQYFYHGDHLGSAQMVTGYDGRVYEHLEYTPYGELWVEHAEQDKASVDKTVFRFTGKERDGETGLYYYGARYLNPQTGLWLSTDPAMGEYVPQAPINDEAKKANGNLPGMGGVFNTVNLHLYHYAGNNPVKYVDPDGMKIRSSRLTLMTSGEGNLGKSKSPISAYGCVLTAYARIASAIAGREITPDEANQKALDLKLFVGSEENLLTREAGAKLITALVDDPYVKVEFVDEFRTDIGNLEGLGNFIDSYDNKSSVYYLTGRIIKHDKNGNEIGHTFNIGPRSVMRNQSGSVDDISYNDTLTLNKKSFKGAQGSYLYGRVDAFRVTTYNKDPDPNNRADGLR
jgi:RHS repeat-associated protein